MKFLHLASLAICFALIQSLPVNITKSTKPATTTTKSYDVYDDYDDKFYKDYYSDDYLAEVVEKEKKAAAIESLKSEQIFELKTTTPKSHSVVEIISSSTKQNAQAFITKAPSSEPATDDEYDLSDYYDYYDDYADEQVDEKASEKTTTKKTLVVTVKKAIVKNNSTKSTAKKINEKVYDYNEYYDDLKLAETTTIPSLVNKKKIVVSTSSTIKATTPLGNFFKVFFNDF